MEEIAQTVMPDVCQIERAIGTEDGQGGLDETPDIVATNIPCRLTSRTGREADAGGTIRPVVQWMLTVPRDTPVESADTVSVGGRTFSVVALMDSSYQIAKRVQLTSIS